MTRFLLLCVIVSLTACASLDSEPPPASTPDGLTLFQSGDFDMLYVREDADFAKYESVFITVSGVEFVDDWKRRQNQRSPSRVTDKDMDRIREMVGQQVVDVFARELSEGSTYRIVDEPELAELVLTAEVTDLDIINPLNNQPYRITVLAEDSGSMKMNAELVDTASDLALLRFEDKARGRDYLDFRRQDTVRVKFENERIMRRWARSLNNVLTGGDSPG